MQKEVKLIVFLFLILSLFVFIFASAENKVTDTTTFEVNVIAEDLKPEIGIEVPDYVFLGNVSKGQSVLTEISVNNTGRLKVNIKPELVSNDKIFKNLYFRESSTSYKKIDDFNMNITASSKKLYIKLDLSNYTEDINENIIGHKADIRFIAVAA